jgi:conjugal transfer ATP-binding protein TraC
LRQALEGSSDPTLKDFAGILYPWSGERPYGRMMDGANSFDLHSDFVVFDLKGLSAYPDLQTVMILIITDFILGKIESPDPSVRVRRKQILMDEAWELLKSPTSSLFMEYCVRTLRKSGSGITFITQGLEELVASPIGPALLANTATKFLLMQRGDLEPARKILKLNEQEVALVSSLRQAKGRYSEAFLIANDSRGIIRAVPSAYEYWLATSDAADGGFLQSLRDQHPMLTIGEIVAIAASTYPKGVNGGG